MNELKHLKRLEDMYKYLPTCGDYKIILSQGKYRHIDYEIINIIGINFKCVYVYCVYACLV